MSRGRLLAVAAAAIVCAAGTYAPLPVAVSVVLAVPLVLVLPGYALVAVLGGLGIGRLHRLALVPALSIALVIVVTLVLNLFPFGLTVGSWALALAVVTVGAAIVAFVRDPGADASRAVERFRIRPLDVLAVVAAAALLAGAVILVRTPLAAKEAAGYTALSLERPSAFNVEVDIVSGELATKIYRLEVRAKGRLVYRKAPIRLSPGSRFSQRIAIHTHDKVSATLYLAGRRHAYRLAYVR